MSIKSKRKLRKIRQVLHFSIKQKFDYKHALKYCDVEEKTVDSVHKASGGMTPREGPEGQITSFPSHLPALYHH
jgi:hypothetical protein